MLRSTFITVISIYLLGRPRHRPRPSRFGELLKEIRRLPNSVSGLGGIVIDAGHTQVTESTSILPFEVK